MSTPYPWIKDSQYGTTPLETGYLEVTSTNGLYLNSTTSGTNSNAILMKGFITGGSTPVTCYYYCDKLRYYPNVWGGETFLSQDMLRFADSANTTLSQLNLSGLSCSNPGVNTYFQSSNNGQYQSIGSSGEEIFISSNSGSGNVYFSAANLYLNGTPIGGGGGVTDIQAGSGISVNQNTGSVTITNTGGGGGGVTDIQAGPGISVNQTTGSVTITNTGGSGGSQDLNSTLSYGNTAYNYSINMNGNSIDNVSTINGSPYPPATPLPENYYFGLQSTYANNNSSTQFTSNTITILTTGNYTITWTFVFDSLFQSPGDKQMVSAYGYLQESGGAGFIIQGAIQNSGVAGSSYISTHTMYRTSYTYTDVYNIYATATFYACILQYNTPSTGTTVYMTASVVKMAN